MLFLSAPELRGIAVGAFLLTAVGVVRSDLGRDAKVTTGLACLSAAAWTLTGSAQASNDVGRPALLLWMTFPAAGFFWAFVSCVFQDRPLRGQDFLPAALLLVLGVFTTVAPESQGLLAVFNAAAAALCLLAMILILRSWPGDLVDSRRSSRVVILALTALFAVAQGTAGTLHWLGRGGEWAAFAVGNDFGSVMISGLALAMGGLLLQARGSLIAKRAPLPAVMDARLDASDRTLLVKLEALMEAGAWRRESLSIGAVARELGTREHRLRRLINARLGHRNFADFVNGYRIEAAKAYLADPAQADATIASIAFDLGFGSLSPFNRAFRAATGATPSAWRRVALTDRNQHSAD